MLDASTRIDVLNLLGDLKSRGLGILFITHDLSLGNYISDSTMILRRGNVVEMGATELVFGNPVHPYTKTLLASVPQLHTKWKDVEAGSERRSRRDGAPAARARDPRRAGRGRGGSLRRPRRQGGVPVTSLEARADVEGPAPRHSVGGPSAGLERRPVALEPQPDHRSRPDPAREQHLQLGRRAVRRRVRGRLPRGRHRAGDEPPRGTERRRRSSGRSTTSRSRSCPTTPGSARSRSDSSTPTTRASPGSRIATT